MNRADRRQKPSKKSDYQKGKSDGINQATDMILAGVLYTLAEHYKFKRKDLTFVVEEIRKGALRMGDGYIDPEFLLDEVFRISGYRPDPGDI